MCLGQRVQQLPGAVGRAIVDNDDLYTDIDGLDSPQHVLDRVTLIIDGDDYRQLGPLLSASTDASSGVNQLRLNT